MGRRNIPIFRWIPPLRKKIESRKDRVDCENWLE
jgi:hypothetical protein